MKDILPFAKDYTRYVEDFFGGKRLQNKKCE